MTECLLVVVRSSQLDFGNFAFLLFCSDVLKQTKQFGCQFCFHSVDRLSCHSIGGKFLLVDLQFWICGLFTEQLHTHHSWIGLVSNQYDIWRALALI